MDGDGVVADDIVIPHLPVNLLGGEHLARVTAQQLEYFVFKRCKTNASPSTVTLLLSVSSTSPRMAICVSFICIAPSWVLAPQLAFHARNQLGRVKRLCNVIIRTRGQSEDFVRVLALGRQQDDRQIFALSYL